MDSDDNILAFDDDSYDGGDYYDSGNDASYEDTEYGNYDVMIGVNEGCSNRKNYTILKEEDFLQRQQDDIGRISTVISVPRDSACLLLQRYKWNVEKLQEAWFADEGKGVRSFVGLLDENTAVKLTESSKQSADCGICFDSYEESKTATCGCGHFFCKTCLGTYIRTAVNDGPGCLILQCPEPSCKVSVGPDMIYMFVSGKEKKRYQQFLLRSYIESKKEIKWCPSPGCEYAVELLDNLKGNISYDVSCLCKNVFCWNCNQDAHSPVNCETVGKWVLKNSSEAENTNWILAYTKPCPKCKRSIEKNGGCMQMTCSFHCNYRFCWLCLQDWHGYGKPCNAYKPQLTEAEKRKEMAKKSIVRYTHYYERWAANELSRQKALKDLRKTETSHLNSLGLKHSQTKRELQFITQAFLQIAECRRVLKWTYAYGYYIPEKEEAKKKFFEYLQGEAEAGLERLHHCAENELQPYINNKESDQVGFNDFRKKLVELTNVTRNYFENLVRALENDLSEVYSLSEFYPLAAGGASSRVKRKEVKSRSSSTVARGSLTHVVDDLEGWQCDRCTYLNKGSATVCKACLADDVYDQ